MANIKSFHPGVYIKDALDAMEMTSKEFSVRTGISERVLSPIINGKGSITFEVAYKLSLFFDNSINYWTNLQNQYELYLREEKIQKTFDADLQLLKKIKKYLIENNYINEEDDSNTMVCKIRSLVGVNSLSLLSEKDSFICLKEQHTKNESDPFLQNFWIALALTEARKINTVAYNKNKLKESIKEIRTLTLTEPKYFYPRLQEIFKECGISFVLLPYLPKSNIYGATKWFSKENVMLAVSNRGESADLFWFTIFHEIAHVLMEHRRETLINFSSSEDDDADQIATDMLICKEKWNEFIDNAEFTVDSINEFAQKQGIHPCIVLGRLHKEKTNLVPYGQYDKHFHVSYKNVS